jgi:hypothetical protein
MEGAALHGQAENNAVRTAQSGPPPTVEACPAALPRGSAHSNETTTRTEAERMPAQHEYTRAVQCAGPPGYVEVV